MMTTLRASALRVSALLILCLQVRAAEPIQPEHHHHRLLMASLAVFATGNTLDTVSSFGPGRETNALLAQNGRFTATSAGIKWGMAGGVIALDLFLIHKYPAAERPIVYSNFATGAVLDAVAVHNFRLR